MSENNSTVGRAAAGFVKNVATKVLEHSYGGGEGEDRGVFGGIRRQVTDGLRQGVVNSFEDQNIQDLAATHISENMGSVRRDMQGELKREADKVPADYMPADISNRIEGYWVKSEDNFLVRVFKRICAKVLGFGARLGIIVGAGTVNHLANDFIDEKDEGQRKRNKDVWTYWFNRVFSSDFSLTNG